MTQSITRRKALGTMAALSGATLIPDSLYGDETSSFRLATFRADVTPRLGSPQYSGAWVEATAIDDPLSAKGVVLLGPEKPIVLVAVDWCEIRNDAFERWRTALAEAAGTTIDRVLVSAIHQHDTPLGELRAQRIIEEAHIEGRLCNVDFHERTVEGVAAAVKEALASARPITHYGIGQAKVEKVASTRRIVLPDGRVTFSRYSRTTDATVQALPEGDIDPWLKTVSFWDGDTPVAALSHYATHPMSYYGGGRVSCEFVGLARERRETDDPRVHQIYFSGCSGDVTAGKYNDGSMEHRARLAERMYQGMLGAWQATERQPLTTLACRAVPMLLPHRNDPGLTPDDLKKTLADNSLPFNRRASAALGLSTRERNPDGQAIDLQAVDLGGAQMVLFPAEAFVASQIKAQSIRPDSFVMALGYGDCAPGYIPTAKDIEEDFVQEHGYSWAADEAEEIIMAAVKTALTE